MAATDTLLVAGGREEGKQEEFGSSLLRTTTCLRVHAQLRLPLSSTGEETVAWQGVGAIKNLNAPII